MLHIDVLTLFPAMLAPVLEHSMLGRAQRAGLVTIAVHQLRDWATGRHKTVDDYPYGGGKGMVMKPEPLFAAVEALRRPGQPVILLDASGERFTQHTAHELASLESLLLVCGHYEGVDERVRQHLVDRTLSIGDYVLTGGELPSLVIVDAVARLVPGVLAEGSADEESFQPLGGAPAGRGPRLLEYPQYTRPVEFRGWRVPDILLSGDHARVTRWRLEQALARTRTLRPDLLDSTPATDEERV